MGHRTWLEGWLWPGESEVKPDILELPVPDNGPPWRFSDTMGLPSPSVCCGFCLYAVQTKEWPVPSRRLSLLDLKPPAITWPWADNGPQGLGLQSTLVTEQLVMVN